MDKEGFDQEEHEKTQQLYQEPSKDGNQAPPGYWSGQPEVGLPQYRDASGCDSCYPPSYLQCPDNKQEQPTVVVVGQTTVVRSVIYVERQPVVSLVGAIVLSVIVVFCCGLLCGIIALILAIVGQNASVAGDRKGAIQLRNASYALSIVGIVVGATCIGLIYGLAYAR